MNSKIPFPSISPGPGRLHFRLPLLALLLWGNALGSVYAAYQDITISPPPCPNHSSDGDPNYKKFGAAAGTSLDNLTTADKTIKVNAPDSVTKVLWGISAGACNTSNFPNVTCGSITIKFPDGVDTTICDPSFPDKPKCAALTSKTATIGGTLNTTTDFDITVTEADDANATVSCAATYHFHTPGSGGWGDPHILTVDGVHYNFQSAGEFTALRGDGLEIQTRQTPVATTYLPGADSYTGLPTCVALYSAVAARVGKHRVSYEPNIRGVPDPSGLQLRVDGVLTKLGPPGIDLGAGRIVQPWGGDGIEIDYSDKTTLIVTPAYWPDQQKWYLNVNLYGATATEGTFGQLAEESWLPALPDGTSLGPKPESLHQRYVDLYQKFADAWRVTDAKSLFDYAPGTSTATFTLGEWPRENPKSCAIPKQPSAQPIDVGVAEKACSAVVDTNVRADCVFDVSVTGFLGFAQTYLLTQQRQPGATKSTVKGDRDITASGESVTFTATVAQIAPKGGGGAPTGTVQFILDGGNVGSPVALDPNARALWSTASLPVGQHQIAAEYTPTTGWGAFVASRSPEESHTVIPVNYWWLIILLIIIILIALMIWRYRHTH
jgi:hypothetical protein